MCGIAGIYRVHPAGAAAPPPQVAIPELWLDILDESIRHRGPDGAGRFRDRTVRGDGATVDIALVHRRMAIIDPAGGAQPMVAAPTGGQGLVAAVFNGCIYNHRELRRELQQRGHHFQTDHSDTEVLLHGWRQWRVGLFDRLIAMGALCLWDRTLGSLVLHRTAPGEKPLYRAWATEPDIFAFASTVPGLLRLRAHIPFFQGHRTFGHWIALGHAPELTPFHEVEHVPYGIPSCHDAWTMDALGLDMEGGSRLPGDPADCEAREEIPLPAGEALERHIESRLADAVAQRLEADVPLGALLSGGVDSSLISLLARRAAGRLTTICIRMPSQRYDESQYAAEVARHIGSEHHTVDAATDGGGPAADLVMLIRQLGLPFGDSSLLPTYWACRAASQHARVVLTGDGGDELFYGYERYQAAGWMEALRLLALLVPTGLLPQRDPKSRWAKAARLVRAARANSYTSLLAIFQADELRQLVPPMSDYMVGWGINWGTEAARNDDLRENLASDMLRKLDTASMAVPIETRAPFLDQNLIRELYGLTPRQAMPRGQRKGLLRSIARRHLPASIVDRPKMGFAIPIGEWFRTDHGGMKQLLMDHLESREPWGPPSAGIELNTNYIRRLLDEHMSGRRDHGQKLYMLLVLSIWANQIANGK
jgi:asparagine synthase (glutamine-hydrolysing)